MLLIGIGGIIVLIKVVKIMMEKECFKIHQVGYFLFKGEIK
jgi:hypothetical protein